MNNKETQDQIYELVWTPVRDQVFEQVSTRVIEQIIGQVKDQVWDPVYIVKNSMVRTMRNTL